MQTQYSCVSDAPATPLVANPSTPSLASQFSAVLSNPNANTDQFNLVAEFLTGLATATGVSITHPAILPYSLPLMLRIAAGESVPPPEPPTTTRVADDQRDTPYSGLWTLCARLAESALTLETGLAPGSTLATELATNPSYQKLQSARADALEFLIRFCRCCGSPLNIWGDQKETLVCRGCVASHPEISDFPELATWAAEYDRVSQPKPGPLNLPPISKRGDVAKPDPNFEWKFFTAYLNNSLRAISLAKHHMGKAVGKPEDPPPSPWMVETSVNEAELLLEEVETFLRRLATVYGVNPLAWKRDERLEEF